MTISSRAAVQPERAWLDAVQADLEQVTEKIRTVSFLNNDLLDAAIRMILTAGGKRMRPAVTLLVGRAGHADYDETIAVAASIELLHTATLIHDDLVDDADARRGAPTMHTKLPLGVTVLTGDFLFAQSAALAAEAENVRIVKTFADTLVNICKGEILQAQSRWQVTSMDAYMERIYGKTAALYEAAAISAAMLSNLEESAIQSYRIFGHEMGIAFQIVDDALDFVAKSEKLGKPTGHDLRQGYITLPAMLYIKDKGLKADSFIAKARDEKQVETLITAIRQQGYARQALDIARKHLNKAKAALESLKWAPEHDLLVNLGNYAVARDF